MSGQHVSSRPQMPECEIPNPRIENVLATLLEKQNEMLMNQKKQDRDMKQIMKMNNTFKNQVAALREEVETLKGEKQMKEEMLKEVIEKHRDIGEKLKCENEMLFKKIVDLQKERKQLIEENQNSEKIEIIREQEQILENMVIENGKLLDENEELKEQLEFSEDRIQYEVRKQAWFSEELERTRLRLSHRDFFGKGTLDAERTTSRRSQREFSGKGTLDAERTTSRRSHRVILEKTRFHLDAELASAKFQKFLDKRQEAAVYIQHPVLKPRQFKKIPPIKTEIKGEQRQWQNDDEYSSMGSIKSLPPSESKFKDTYRSVTKPRENVKTTQRKMSQQRRKKYDSTKFDSSPYLGLEENETRQKPHTLAIEKRQRDDYAQKPTMSSGSPTTSKTKLEKGMDRANVDSGNDCIQSPKGASSRNTPIRIYYRPGRISATQNLEENLDIEDL